MPRLPLRPLLASFPLEGSVTAIALDAPGSRAALAGPEEVRVLDTASGATIARLAVQGATRVAIGRSVLALAHGSVFMDGARRAAAEAIAVDADTGEALAADGLRVLFLDSGRRLPRTRGTVRSLVARSGLVALSVDRRGSRRYAWAVPTDLRMRALRDHDVLQSGAPEEAGEAMGVGITDAAEPCVFIERGGSAGRRKCLYKTTYRMGPRVITLMRSAWMDPVAISANGLVTLWRRRALPELATHALVTAHAHDPDHPTMCAIDAPGTDTSAMAFALSKDGSVAAIVSEGALHIADAR